MALYELMRSRRSVRRFKPEHPGRQRIERLLEAAITAPSASNKQPWRFFVVSSPPRIAAMATAVREAVDRVAGHVEPASEESFRSYGSYFTRFEAAPVVVVALFRPLTVLSHLVDAGIAAADRERIEVMERQSGLIGTSMALQNLLLAAHEMGLGASGMTGPLVASERLREILEVPASWHIAALVPIGFPDEEPGPTGRKPLDKVVRWIDEGNHEP
jgi:nitroreductase